MSNADVTVLPVSVIVPSFRRKHYLAQALASVQAQVGVRPQEVIVVDDASGDGTADLARSLGATVIEKTRNEGLAAARADAVEAAGGAEWLALLDDDDQWLPHHLATVWAARGHHVMVSSSSVSFGANPLAAHGTPRGSPEVLRSPARLLFPENSVTASASFVRRDAVLAAGGFDRTLRYMEDIDLWLRVLELGSGLLLPDVTCLYRRHVSQLSGSRAKMSATAESILAKYAGRSWMTKQVTNSWQVVEHWDDLQAARYAGQWPTVATKALWLLGRPARPAALVRLWAFRRQVRRRVIPAEVVKEVEAATMAAGQPAGS